MASFQLLNSEVVRAVLVQAGLGRTAADMDSATEGDVRAIIRAGLRRAYFPTQNGYPYQWRWLETKFSVSAEEVFDDGTIEVSGGTVTLTGGTFPADMIDHYIEVEGHVLFVTERTDDTHVEVSHTQLTIASGTSYEAPRYRYDLPSDFGEFIGGVVYADGENSWCLAGSSEPELRLRYAIGQDLGTDTTHWAVFDGKIYFWPTPAPDAFIQSIYIAVPDDNLPADLTTPGSTAQVDPIFAEVFMEAILAAAEAYNDDTAGIHEQRFQVALQAAIAHDQIVGGHYDFSHRAVPRNHLGHGEILPLTFS